FNATVQLTYPSGYSPVEGVTVKLLNTLTGTAAEAATDATGTAVFETVAGVYEASASESRSVDNDYLVFNGVKSGLIVADADISASITLTASKASRLVIKELYNGGCLKNEEEGGGTYQYDKYVVLYNNSDAPVSLDSLCFGMVNPYNSGVTNNDYVAGELLYAAEGWIPAGQGIWTFRSAVSLDPGKQIVVAVNSAINHTQTYANSVNFANAEYYAMYDLPVYTNTNYYAPPSELIPTSHYLKGYLYGAGNAWSLSVLSPAFFIFTPQGMTPSAFVASADNIHQYNNSASAANTRKKVPVEWIVDGIEVFQRGKTNNVKRLTPAVDAGYVELTNYLGYTLYRNVDKDFTEALPENEGKLVYNYAGGTADIEGGTTDPSGIDAEASLKNGARIIYKDTNNSTNDFHQRKLASLKN
ncbi:MAG: DUF4876 domain-containing protein, partial [Bacteroidales bacterium]|nr:DUF4876 domain-containing protein [Bacteroidales bacterium]